MRSFREVRAFLPVAVATGFIAALGLAKALFALQSLHAEIVVGPRIGPSPLIVLSSLDLAIGITALIVGFAFVLRRRWARNTLVHGWAPLLLYEIGRGLGLAVVGLTIADVQSVVLSVLLMGSVVVVGLCARSSASDAYVGGVAPGS